MPSRDGDPPAQRALGPGLGPKSAKRIVLKLINNRDELVKPIINTLAEVYKNVTRYAGSLTESVFFSRLVRLDPDP